MDVFPDLTRIFTVTPDQMAKFRVEAAENGIALPGLSSGQAMTHGVVIDYAYDGVSSLVLTIVSKPFYIPASVIWTELRSYLG